MSKCKIIITEKNLIKILGNSSFNSIEEIELAFSEKAKNKFAIYKSKSIADAALGKEYSGIKRNPKLDYFNGNIIDGFSKPIDIFNLVRLQDDPIKVEEIDPSEDSGIEQTKIEEIDTPQAEIQAEPILQSPVKSDLLSTASRDVIKGELTDKEFAQAQRKMLEQIYNLKDTDYHLTLIGNRDIPELQQDDSLIDNEERDALIKGGQVAILTKEKVNSVEELFENAIRYKGKIYPFSIETRLGDSENQGSFFGTGERIDLDSRDNATYQTAIEIRMRNSELSEERVRELYKQEQAELINDRREVAATGGKVTDNFITYKVTGISDGIYPYNKAAKSLKELKYKFDNLSIDESGIASVEVITEEGNKEIAVKGTKLTQKEIDYIIEKFSDKNYTESIQQIVGDPLKDRLVVNTFKVTDNDITYTYLVNKKPKSLTFKRDDSNANQFRELLEGITLKDGIIKRNVSTTYLNGQLTDQLRDDLYNQANFPLDQWLYPIHTLYKYKGKLTTVPASRYLTFTKIEQLSEFDIINNNIVVPQEDIVQTKESSPTGNNAPAWYSNGKIYIKEIPTPEQLLEEKIHYHTVNWLKNNKDSLEYKQLQTLLDRAKKAYKGGKDRSITYSLYGVPRKKDYKKSDRDIIEFVARGISDPKTVEFLKGIPVENQTWFDKFTELVSRILRKLGFTNNDSNIYQELVKFNLALINQEEIVDLEETDIFNDEDLEDFDLDIFETLANPFQGLQQIQIDRYVVEGLDYYYGQYFYANKDKISSPKELLNGLARYITKQKSNELIQYLFQGRKPNKAAFVYWSKNSSLFKLNDIQSLLEDNYVIQKESEKAKFDRTLENPFNEVNNKIKNLLSTLPKYKKGKLVTDRGIPQLADFGQVYAQLLDLLSENTGIQNIKEILRKQNNLTFQAILDRMPESNLDDLWTSFYQSFNLPEFQVKSLKTFNDGSMAYISETGDNIQKLKKIFEVNFEKLYKNNSQYFTVDDRGYYVNDKYKALLLKRVKDQEYKKAFQLLGFDFSEETYLDPTFIKQSKRFFTFKSGSDTDSRFEYFLNNIERFNLPTKQFGGTVKGKKGLNNLMNELFKVESIYSDVTKTLVSTNAENEKVANNTLPNTFTQLVKAFNNKLDLPIISNNFKTALFKSSIIAANNKEIAFDNYNGKKTEDLGNVTRNLSDRDWIIMNVQTLLKEGTMEILRTETSSSSWAFKFKDGSKWIQNRERFINQMKRYWDAEQIRINKSEGHNIKNYSGDTTNYFSEISDSKNWNEVLPKLEEYINKKIADNKKIFEYYRITKGDFKLNHNHINDIVEDFTLNNLIYGIEQSIFFYGDLAHWKDFYKRNKGIISTGRVPRIDEAWWSNQESKLSKNKYSPIWKTMIIKDKEYNYTPDTKEYQKIKSELIESLKLRYKGTEFKFEGKVGDEALNAYADTKLKPYENMEIADGQGYINLDAYRLFLKSVDNWNKKDEQLYNWEVENYQARLRGEVYNIPAPKHSFSILKSQYFGGTNSFPELNLQIFDKFSLAPLTPSVYIDTPMESLMKDMLDNNIAYAKMSSATKGAINKNKGQELSVVDYFGEKISNPDRTFPEVYEVHVGLMKEQLKTNSKYKKENIFGSQFRKLLAQDMTNKNGNFFNKELEQSYKAYTNNLAKASKLAKESLFQELGIKENGSNLIIEDYNPLLNRLLKESQDRELPKATVDFIKLNLKGKVTNKLEIPFEASGAKQTLQNLLQGMINKKLIRQKVNGAQLIQLSPANWGDEDLKFYNYNGGKPTAAQVKIAMSDNFQPLLDKYGSLDKLNEALKDNPVTIIGYRIPTQGLNSMDVFEIHSFLPRSLGNAIITPPEIVAKSGADFDIDKMSFIFPSYDSGGNLLNQDKNSIAEEVAFLKEEYGETIEKLKDSIARKEFHREGLPDFKSLLERLEIDPKDSQAKVLLGKFKQYSTKTEKTNLKQLEGEIEEILKLGTNKYQTKRLNNELIKITRGILLNKVNYHHLMTPLGTDIIEGHAEVIAGKLGRNSKDSKGKIIEFGTHLRKRKSLYGAMRLLGAAATSTTFLQLYMKAGAKFTPSVPYLLLSENENNSLKENGIYNLSNPINVEGDFKSEISNQYVNGTVDAAKNDFLGKINYVMDNIGLIMYMNLVGVPPKRVMNFVNQPSIYNYLRYKEQGDKKAYDKVIREITHKLVGSPMNLSIYNSLPENNLLKDIYQIDGKGRLEINYQFSDIPLNNLFDSIGINYKDKQSEQYYLEQIQSLIHYKQLKDQSTILFNYQQYASPDTNTSQTPLHNYLKENRKNGVTNLVTQKTVDNMVNNSSISSFFQRDTFNKIFKEVFPYQWNGEFIDTAIEIIEELKLPGTLQDKLIRTLSNDYMLYSIIQNREDNPKELLTNFHKELAEFRKDKTQFKFLNELYRGVNPNDPYSTLELRTSDQAELRDIYTKEIEILSEQAPEFTDKLIKTGFYQTGFNRTFYSWSSLIPPKLLSPILETGLGNIDMEQFKDEFLKERKEFKEVPILDREGLPTGKKRRPKSTNRPMYLDSPAQVKPVILNTDFFTFKVGDLYLEGKFVNNELFDRNDQRLDIGKMEDIAREQYLNIVDTLPEVNTEQSETFETLPNEIVLTNEVTNPNPELLDYSNPAILITYGNKDYVLDGNNRLQNNLAKTKLLKLNSYEDVINNYDYLNGLVVENNVIADLINDIDAIPENSSDKFKEDTFKIFKESIREEITALDFGTANTDFTYSKGLPILNLTEQDKKDIIECVQ